MLEENLNDFLAILKDKRSEIIVGLVIAAIIAVCAIFWKQFMRFLNRKSPPPSIDDKLMDRNEALAEKHGATKAQLHQLLTTLKAHNIPPEQLDTKLEKMLSREQETLERLEATANVDADTDQLRKEAEEAIRAGDTDKAMNRLHQAETRDTQAAVGLDDEADDRRRAASQSAFAQGDLAFNRLDYTAAANHFERAAGLLPVADALGRGEALNRVGLVFLEIAKYPEAEITLNEARSLLEEALAPNDPELAAVLNNLAQLYQDTDRLSEAEPLMVKALKIDEASLGPDHPNVAIRLNNLAQLYKATDRPREAESLMVRALGIFAASLGPDHPKTVTVRDNLASLRRK